MKFTHINDSSKPLILLGTSANITKVLDICTSANITVAGIIDDDYFGNTEIFEGIPVIDKTSNLYRYKSNYNFFCAINWSPISDTISVRNKQKRLDYLNLIESNKLECISLVDQFSRIASTATIGHGVFIDAFVLIEPKAVVGDFTSIYAFTGIGHHTVIERNCVFQRHCSIAGSCVFEENTFVSVAVKALKEGAIFGKGTFIHESMYIRRGTIPNEVVSIRGNNLSRVYDMAEISQLS